MLKNKELESLILRSSKGDKEAIELLILEFEEEIKRISYKYYITGGDHEDIVQTGRLGVYRAIKTYKQGRSSDIKSFILMSIKRNIITLIRNNSRIKHSFISDATDIKGIYETNKGVMKLEDTIENTRLNIEQDYIDKESTEELMLKLNRMSEMERSAFVLSLEGYSYEEIGIRLNLTYKQVDNALQRLKGRMKKLIA